VQVAATQKRAPAKPTGRRFLCVGWLLAIGLSVGVRLWNAFEGPLMWGYDAWGHVAYVLFLDLYGGVPWADQGWSYFHPPLHYALGWLLTGFGSGEVLMRGLSLLGSAMSLGTAVVASGVIRHLHPDRPGFALIGFTVLALLPAQLFMSPMPGNEMTLTFLVAAAVGVFAVCGPKPRPAIDVSVGVLIGLALLTKFSGLLALLVILAALGVQGLLRRSEPGAIRSLLRRALVIAALSLAMAAPYYARNVAAFGTPFQLSRDFPLVAEVERGQPPGSRSWTDYFRWSSRTFSKPDPRSPALLHAVWSSVYLNVWADVYRESDVAATPEQKRREQRSFRTMALLGLLPTLLFLAGGGLAVGDVVVGRRRDAYLPLLLLAGASGMAFVAFSWRVPQWSALKSAYLMGLSLPFPVFVIRALAFVEQRAPALPRALLPALLCGTAVWSGYAALEGIAFPRRADAPAAGAVHYYFGEYDAARRLYARLVAGAGYKVPWLENLAALELAQGDYERARADYERSVRLAERQGRHDPSRTGRLAVAQALAGDLPAALGSLDAAIGAARLPDLLNNRGVLRARSGDLGAARRDFRDAAALDRDLTAAWWNLARVGSDDAQAAEAIARAREAACSAPRHYPYGLGTGEILEWGIGRRPLLVLDDDSRGGFHLLLPRDQREACALLAKAST